MADLLNHLFATKLSPRGKPYTMSEVSAGTEGKLSVSYINAFRRGRVAIPGADKVQALADFFEVSPSYFTGSRAPSTTEGQQVDEVARQVMSNAMLRQISVGASELDDEQQAAILKLIEHARTLGKQARAKRAQREDGQPKDGESDAQVAPPVEPNREDG